MTEKIDLDELDVGEQDDETDAGNRGDWLWQDDGPPADEAETTPADEPETTPADGEGPTGEPDAVDDQASEAVDAVPHVPRSDRKNPAGIPKSQGGSGAGAGAEPDDREPQHPEEQHSGSAEQTGSTASGPHGGGVDDMTTAYTYEALQHVDDVQLVLAETNEWSDWVGIIGEVPAHAINKLQRDHQVDVDFFNGSGSGPAERLADVDEHSMFYAERMVVVGAPDQEWIADESGWEYVPLADAAAGAGWEYEASGASGE